MLSQLPILLFLALCSAQDYGDLDSIASQSDNSAPVDDETRRRVAEIFKSPSAGSNPTPGGTFVPLPTTPTPNDNSAPVDDETRRRVYEIFKPPSAGSNPIPGGTFVPLPTTPTPNDNSSPVDEETKRLVNEIFRSPFEGSNTTPGGTSAPLLTPNTNCITNSGAAGVCVTHNLCNKPEPGSTDGTGAIQIRIQASSKCGSYMLTCCLLSETRPADEPLTPKPEPNEVGRVGCGWHNPKGVGIRTTGEEQGETKFGEFPWMCAIIKTEPAGDNPGGLKVNVYMGGGSLIHPSVVLTAAHYVAAAAGLRVRAGEWDTRTTKEPFPYQDREVARAEIHKDFNNGNLFYDIAVLFLAKPLQLAPNVQPACLPPPDVGAAAGTRCFATGWGKEKFGEEGRYQVIMKKVEVPVVDNPTCLAQLRKTILGSYFELHPSFMCAGGERGKDVCEGDGGAPLSCPIEDEPGRFVQAGIVAWGIGCGTDGVPGVYVDVSKLRKWVDDKVIGAGYTTTEYSYY